MTAYRAYSRARKVGTSSVLNDPLALTVRVEAMFLQRCASILQGKRNVTAILDSSAVVLCSASQASVRLHQVPACQTMTA